MNLGGSVRFNKTGICIIAIFGIILIIYMTRSINVDTTSKFDNQKSNDLSMSKLLLAAINMAEKGGLEVVNIKNKQNLNIKSKGLTNDGVVNPVTEADLNSHCVMFYGLKKLFPALQIISEEERSEKECEEVVTKQIFDLDGLVNFDPSKVVEEVLPIQDITVWIDPLDATKEFTENLLEYITTLVCVAYKGIPIMGVIHRPFGTLPKTSWAWVNKAKSEDLNPIKKTEEVIIISRSHIGEGMKMVHNAFGDDVKVVTAGGAGYKVMQLVTGNATAYIHSKYISKWDICAGNAILNALGGHMTTLKNEDLDYSSSSNFKNSQGLIATVTNHDYYANKLKKFIADNIV
uniref:Putative inositol monophosphatase 3 n=1 Tax=Clastoptera arizonana TaxID=38151 RepID=A0A1B6CG61_9HEMI